MTTEREIRERWAKAIHTRTITVDLKATVLQDIAWLLDALQAEREARDRAVELLADMQKVRAEQQAEVERLRGVVEMMQRTARTARAHECPGWECSECDWQSWDDVATQALAHALRLATGVNILQNN